MIKDLIAKIIQWAWGNDNFTSQWSYYLVDYGIIKSIQHSYESPMHIIILPDVEFKQLTELGSPDKEKKQCWLLSDYDNHRKFAIYKKYDAELDK